jgi:restriction system protein
MLMAVIRSWGCEIDLVKKSEAEFIRWMPGILNALRQMGGSGTARDVIKAVAKLENVSAEKQEARNKGGALRFYNQVAWARQYLAWEGLLDSTKRGIWTLTEKGLETKLSAETSQEVFSKFHAQTRSKPKESSVSQGKDIESSTPFNSDAFKIQHREALIELLQNISADGFERLCRDLMLEMGLSSVVCIGKTGDGGIDGYGLLELNLVVTLRVAYQCKKYSSGVGAPQIRDFQSAIRGKFDKGILFSTGHFTSAAEKQAAAPGNEFIELIDGERLMELLEKLEFGLTPKTVFDINFTFFDKYKLKHSEQNS